jgi:crossover junction endodeoxyribonuclease RusA
MGVIFYQFFPSFNTSVISDVDSHRRFLSDAIDVTNLPPLLIEGVTVGEECIYIRVCLAENLETYL